MGTTSTLYNSHINLKDIKKTKILLTYNLNISKLKNKV